MADEMTRARELLAPAARIVVFTGAGVSAESGMPTFRGAGGREDEWQVRPARPPRLALLGKAAGLDARELTGRSLVLPG